MHAEEKVLQTSSGMLNLNIARLEGHLKLLEQQQLLSSAYPNYQASLAKRQLQIQAQLQKLRQHRNMVM